MRITEQDLIAAVKAISADPETMTAAERERVDEAARRLIIAASEWRARRVEIDGSPHTSVRFRVPSALERIPVKVAM